MILLLAESTTRDIPSNPLYAVSLNQLKSSRTCNAHVRTISIAGIEMIDSKTDALAILRIILPKFFVVVRGILKCHLIVAYRRNKLHFFKH